MLQLQRLNAMAHEELAAEEGFPPGWADMAELEQVVDDWIGRWLEKRAEVARRSGLFSRLHDGLDRWIRTDEIELLDDPDYPVAKKVKIVQGVHRFNAMYRTYARYLKLLTPLIREVAAREGRPTRMLELASGAGELAMAICKQAGEQDLPVEITGSDYIAEYVEQGATAARERDLPMGFREINAFEMEGVEDGEFDILVINGSTHHFTPGQLARMIAQAKRVATTAFVNIDGVRSLSNILGPIPYPALTFQYGLLHDAIVSGRKFFSVYELTHISRIAAPGTRIGMESAFPMACLTVRFD